MIGSCTQRKCERRNRINNKTRSSKRWNEKLIKVKKKLTKYKLNEHVRRELYNEL